MRDGELGLLGFLFFTALAVTVLILGSDGKRSQNFKLLFQVEYGRQQ